MADTSIDITAGAGTSVDTRTEATNGNHRQVIVVGDPSTNAGVAPVDGTAGLKVDLGADNDVTVTSGTITAVTAITNALPAGTNNIGDVDVLSSALPTGASTSANQTTVIGHLDGVETLLGTIDADTSTLAGAVAGTEMQVDVLTMPTVTVNSHAVTNAGTFAVQAASAGDVAHDAVDSGNPIKVGGKAVTAVPTSVASGDRVDAAFTKSGELLVHNTMREMIGNQVTTITSSTSETTIVTADATYLLDIHGLILTNTSASATKVTIKDATAGTTRMIFQVPATSTVGFMLPSSDGHKQATVNNNWTATCGTSVADLVVTAIFSKNL